MKLLASAGVVPWQLFALVARIRMRSIWQTGWWRPWTGSSYQEAFIMVWAFVSRLGPSYASGWTFNGIQSMFWTERQVWHWLFRKKSRDSRMIDSSIVSHVVATCLCREALGWQTVSEAVYFLAAASWCHGSAWGHCTLHVHCMLFRSCKCCLLSCNIHQEIWNETQRRSENGDLHGKCIMSACVSGWWIVMWIYLRIGGLPLERLKVLDRVEDQWSLAGIWYACQHIGIVYIYKEIYIYIYIV